MIDTVKKYFDLNDDQSQKLEFFVELLLDWNEKINLISRQDQNNIWIRHILHSLAIAKAINLDNAKIIDVGTGGGLPGVPLAIIFPNAHFTLIDSIGKKITAVQDIIKKLALANAVAIHANSKQIKEKYNFVTARAVTDFRKFYKLTKHLLTKANPSDSFQNGILYLKGGEFDQEIASFKERVKIFELSNWFDEPFFETKKLIYLRF